MVRSLDSSTSAPIHRARSSNWSRVIDPLPAGLNLREDTAGLNLREETAGLNLREETAGLNLREETAGLNLREETAGLNLREETVGLNLREETVGLNLTPVLSELLGVFSRRVLCTIHYLGCFPGFR